MPKSITCLDKLVSVNGHCGSVETDFNLLDLPGWDLDLIESASNKTETGLEVIDKTIRLAHHELKQEIITRIQPRFKAATLIDFETLGEYQEDTIALEVDFYRGIYVRITRRSHLALLLNSIRLLFKADVSDNIVVINLRTGETIDTIAFEATANSVLNVDLISSKKYPSNKLSLDLFIGINGGLADMASTTLHSNQFNAGGCCGDPCYGYNHNYASFTTKKLPIAGPFNINALVNINDTGGMSFDYGIACEIEGLLCGLGEMLGNPLLYLVGSMCVDAVRNSRNYDDNNTLHADRLEAMQLESMEKFNQKLDTLLSAMGKNITDGLCFECNRAVRVVVSIP